MKNKEKYDIRYMTFNVSQNKNGTIKSIDIYYDLRRIEKIKFLNETSATYAMNAIGEWLEQEYKPPILDDVENAYLSAVIKPFRNEVECIVKYMFSEEKEFLAICLHNGEEITLPIFIRRTMYKGMKSRKEYTLEELGL